MGRGRGGVFFGIFLLVVGVIFLVGQFLSINIWSLFFPALLIILGLWLIFARTIFGRSRGANGKKVVSFTTNTFGASGSGDITSMMLNAGNITGGTFNRVSYKSVGNLTLHQGDHEELVIEAPAAIKEHIRAEVKDSTLEISYDQDWWDWFDFGWRGSGPIEYSLTMREIAGLSMSGAGKLNASQIKTSKLEIEHSGAGEIAINNLVADELSIRQHGVGNVILKGQVTQQTVVLSGAGNYRTGDLQSHTANVNLFGVGKVTVWVSDTLDVKMSGIGNVEYYGSPSVTQHLTGIGKLKSLGNR